MFSKLIPIVGFAISIASFVYLFKIRADTKEDTFQQSIDIGKKDKLFYTQTTPFINPSDIGLKCELYQLAIMNPKVNKLNYVFDLNIENIHNKTNLLIIIFVLVIVFLFLPLFWLLLYYKTKSFIAICLIFITIFINYILYLVNIILTFLLVYDYYKADTNKFVDFLSCRNVNKNEFDKYLYAKKLKKDFTIFIILNIIGSLMNYNTNKKVHANNQFYPREKGKQLTKNEQPSVEMVQK